MALGFTDKNIWANLLAEVQSQSSQRLPSGKILLILGDEEVGKTSLIAKIKKDTEITKGYALEYISMEVKDEEREDFTRLGMWIGDSRCYDQGDSTSPNKGNSKSNVLPSLLKYAVSGKNFADTILIISVSMSRPWTILESLNKWIILMKRHIDSLLTKVTPSNSPYKSAPREQSTEATQLDKESLSHKEWEVYKENLIKRYLGYMDRDNKLYSGGESEKQSFNEVNGDLSSDISLTSTHFLPMMLQDENILTNNIGIPTIVVVTKTDMIPELEKEYDFRNEHFDFIQQHIRKFCLTYGAGLVYTSCKENKNCDLLRQYILHLQYGFPFKTGPKIVDNDSIFIPIGWDSTKKIAILNEGLSNLNPEDKFEDVLGKPPARKEAAKVADVLAEDEQIFLSRMQNLLSQPIKSKNEMMVNRSSIAVQKNLDRSGRLTSSYQNPAKLIPATAMEKPLSKMVLMNNTLTSGAVGTGGVLPISNSTGTGAMKTPENNISCPGGTVGGTNSERILTYFFNSLLQKGKTGTAPSSTNKTTSNSGPIPSDDKTFEGTQRDPNDSNIPSAALNLDTFEAHCSSALGEEQSTNQFTSFEGNAADTPTNDMSLNDVVIELNRLTASTPRGQSATAQINPNEYTPPTLNINGNELNEDPLSFLKPPAN